MNNGELTSEQVIDIMTATASLFENVDRKFISYVDKGKVIRVLNKIEDLGAGFVAIAAGMREDVQYLYPTSEQAIERAVGDGRKLRISLSIESMVSFYMVTEQI